MGDAWGGIAYSGTNTTIFFKGTTVSWVWMLVS